MGLWSKVVHYVGNRMPVRMHAERKDELQRKNDAWLFATVEGMISHSYL